MKAEGVVPDKTTYHHILSQCGHHAAAAEAWAVLEDMVAMGIFPDRDAFHNVIRALYSREMRGTWQLLQLMHEAGVPPDAKTFDLVMNRLLESENIELALTYMALMSTRGITPLIHTAAAVIRSAAEHGLPRLALDIAYGFEKAAVRRLEGETWMDCLIASAEASYAEGVVAAWQKCVEELGMLPDEGCCILVLNTAARAGNPKLALDVIRVLQSQNVTWEEHHFAPLIEAFNKAGELKQALEVLGTMQKYGVVPNAGTTQAILHTVGIGKITLDSAWHAVDELHREGKIIDVSAMNIVVRAAVRASDLQRAFGIYKTFSDFNVVPNVDTFNILLSGCVRLAHRELGDKLMAEMREAGMKADATTYKRVIALCLTQPTYEDAFFYLEEMKSEGITPPRTVYDLLIRKCVSTGDPRYQLAVDELLSQGYQMTPGLQTFIDSGGQQQGASEEEDFDAGVVFIDSTASLPW
ncbi:hypothetical protein EIP91_003966 [Steccherinum ochraceum]|uniref:Pentatricopeptide repeat-containing protein-mitochondrial domain-containing protein n=1 Tax=Steccherinum ochraceum TaxID=92696 RepID=A0A4V2MXJ2_9APHY|nr:hypothetical protein EIP91_003966 [Steccherinum ochraceum]